MWALRFLEKLLCSILGLYRDHGKENGKYYTILGYIWGLYKDNGKENGNYETVSFGGLLRSWVPFSGPVSSDSIAM